MSSVLTSLLSPAAALAPAVAVGGAVLLGLAATDPTPNAMAVQTLVDPATVTNPINTFLIKQLWDAWRLQVMGYGTTPAINVWNKMVFERLQNGFIPVITTTPQLLEVNITYLDSSNGLEGNGTFSIYSIVPENYPSLNYGIPAPAPIQGYVMGL